MGDWDEVKPVSQEFTKSLDAKSKLAEAQGEIEGLRHLLEKQDADLDRLHTEVASLEESMCDLQAYNNSLIENVSGLELKVDKQSAELERLRRERDCLKRFSDVLTDNVNGLIDQLSNSHRLNLELLRGRQESH